MFKVMNTGNKIKISQIRPIVRREAFTFANNNYPDAIKILTHMMKETTSDVRTIPLTKDALRDYLPQNISFDNVKRQIIGLTVLYGTKDYNLRDNGPYFGINVKGNLVIAKTEQTLIKALTAGMTDDEILTNIEKELSDGYYELKNFLTTVQPGQIATFKTTNPAAFEQVNTIRSRFAYWRALTDRIGTITTMVVPETLTNGTINT